MSRVFLVGQGRRMPPWPGASVLLAAALGVAAWWGLAPAAARGHELGPFQVYGTFQRDGAFRLDVKIDQEHLPPGQLGGPARATRYGRIAGLGGPTEERFGRYLSDLADSLTVAFDGVPVAPTLAMDPDRSPGSSGGGGGAGSSGGPVRATLRVEGWVPGGARAFTLASSLPVKSYPLVLRCEGDESSTWRWVEGGATSPPYLLAPGVAPPPAAAVARRCFAAGFARVLPHGPMPLLLAAALFLLARRPGATLWMLAALALGQGLGLTLALRGAVTPRPALLEPLLALSVAGLALAGLVALPAVPDPGGPLSVPVPSAPSAPPDNPGRRRLGRLWRLGGSRLLRLPVASLILLIGALVGVGFAAAVPGRPAAGIGTGAGAGTGIALLPPPLLPAAVGGFALGAAAAELAVVAAAFVLVGLPYRDRPWYRGRVVVPACCLIALIGLYWSLSGLLS